MSKALWIRYHLHLLKSPMHYKKIFSRSTGSWTAPLCLRIPIHHIPAEDCMQVTGIWEKTSFPNSLDNIPWGLPSGLGGGRHYHPNFSMLTFSSVSFLTRWEKPFHFRLTLERTAVWSAPHEINTVFQCSKAPTYVGQSLSGKKIILLNWKSIGGSHIQKKLENRRIKWFSALSYSN